MEQSGCVIADWTIGGLLHDLAGRGQHPAIISFGENGIATWDAASVADNALRLAAGLRGGENGGGAVALCAPNSPAWIIAALAALAAGRTLVPIDDLADSEQIAEALSSSNARLVITTTHHLEECGEKLCVSGVGGVVLDNAADSKTATKSWQSMLSDPADGSPAVDSDESAVLTWTSGTTGSAKAFVLTHRNIAVNVEALQRLDIVGPHDRALLPLPLHHAYPFVVGMLTALTLGTAIVLPGASTGPSLIRALREAEVTTIVGVPRLYEALVAAIAAYIGAEGRAIRLVWHALLKLAILVQRVTGNPLGRALFARVRRGVGPRLRLLVSGGARLERRVEEQLQALGWDALSGYGLAETASLFTCNRPHDRRTGSAGRPLPGNEIRIARPDDHGIGEIELHGGSITKGYLDDPEANRATFTLDGWFRTGDLGFVDHDGFLFITGRTKETLVLGGGKKVNPEELERIYGRAPEIAELALLENKGALVALVRPDQIRLRERGITNLHDGIRVLLGEEAQGLPSYQRLSGFALTGDPLPRTRLGKYRRFLLPGLYAQAVAGAACRPPRSPTPADAALLREPAAAAAWQVLREYFPDRPLDLDNDLGLDLNLDSFGWMELSILLHERAGVALSEADLARIATIRDLLRMSIDRQSGTTAPVGAAPAFALDSDYWLAPTGLSLTVVGLAIYAVNRGVVRGVFRLRVCGIDRLPAAGPFVITPNHVSYLDGLVVAAALPWSRLRRVYWAGDSRRLFPHSLTRVFCRAVHLFPVEELHPGAALETANRILAAGDTLVWFPEGWRAPDGRLQRFLPGIGEVLLHSSAPAVPTSIHGTFEALPRGHRIPRWHRLTVTFGGPAPVGILHATGVGRTDEERVADGLRRRLVALAESERCANR
ncbi:MAG TPA: AMP-binding protein [Stellaceae bacterium]|nr:AMP-binding protein [Stellaceae bacterium]